jgi:DNA-binding NarL/FixJ family response regulator
LAELVSAVEALGHGDRFLSSAISDHLVQAVTDPARTTPVDSYQSLTAREREVFMLIAMGLSNTEIGNRLFVSPRTAETHRANIMRKLKLRSQTDAVLLAVRRGLVPAA